MASSSSSFRHGDHALFLLLLAFLSLAMARHATGEASTSPTSRRLMELYKPPPSDLLRYHDGAVLSGDILISVLWYGRFTPAQKAIVTDFLLSLSTSPPPSSPAPPSVSQWWGTIDRLYLSKADAASVGKPGANGGGKTKKSSSTRVVLTGQVSDEGCSLGKSLTLAHLPALAAATAKAGGLALVLTAQDVAVEGFCMSRCGHHGSFSFSHDARAAYAWVGNPATQCPGQCAWPFHQPVYGPQSPVLVPPNGDVGMDGAVMSVASMVAGAVTNPFGDARSGTGYTRATAARRWRPPRRARASTAVARTPGTPGSCWWTRPRVPATTRTARAGGSTCSPRCMTPTRVRVPPWSEERDARRRRRRRCSVLASVTVSW